MQLQLPGVVAMIQLRTNKNKKLYALFLLIELVLYLCFLYIDIFRGEEYRISSIIKFISIVGCLMFSILVLEQQEDFKSVYLIRVAMFFTVISDVFLLLTSEIEKGIFTFCIVQGIYRYYLWKVRRIDIRKDIRKDIRNDRRKDRFSIFIYAPNVMIGLMITIIMYTLSLEVNRVLIITTFYFTSILINVVVAFRLALKVKKAFITIFAIGMFLFLLCDINVGIFNLSEFLYVDGQLFQTLYLFSTVGMWLFYLPSQVLLVLSFGFNE
ncbi:MAG: lysoplasmalogenase family protein [Anaerocolumna sp.]